LSADTNVGIVVEFDVPAQMRDGVILRADVYRPPGTGSFPTLLVRTPYGKGVASETQFHGVDPVAAARAGFLVVIQDVRGRFASDGDFEPLRHEAFDGHDSVEWAATLHGSNGRVGMLGGSYCGNTQWRAASQRPPHLRAIAPNMTWADPRDGLFARGGAHEVGLDLAWSLLTSADDVERLGLSPEEAERRLFELVEQFDELGTLGGWLKITLDRGIATTPSAGEVALRLARSTTDEDHAIGAAADVGQLPVFNTGGWFDVFLQGTLDNYQAMIERGLAPRLLIGPWSHDRLTDPVGDRVSGVLAGRDGVPVHPHGDWAAYQLAWLRDQLTEDAPMEFPAAPVRIFVMGRNEWRDEPAWPLARARTHRWFLHASGELSTAAPSAQADISRFTYDPSDPVPTLGGNVLLGPGFRTGSVDQRPIEQRPDVLVFTSAPLEAELEITGPIHIVLHARSSAASADWVGRLCDVAPDGTSLNLCDGILRVGRDGDGFARHEIDLWATSNVFLAGHQLRVHVTSSSFPRWDRNLDTGSHASADDRVAHQRVSHASDRPSYVELPVVP
jgi:putative CocE/NonD family hydrolase